MSSYLTMMFADPEGSPTQMFKVRNAAQIRMRQRRNCGGNELGYMPWRGTYHSKRVRMVLGYGT